MSARDVPFPTAPPMVAPPGWYPGPGGDRWLWWDGSRWHEAAAQNGPDRGYRDQSADQSVDQSADRHDRWLPRIDPLRRPAAVVAIGFVVILTVASRVPLGDDWIGAFWAVAMLASSVIGMPLVAVWASRRCGSASLRRDLGWSIRWVDVPLGLGAALALTIGIIIFNVAASVVGVPGGSNLNDVAESGRDPLVFATLGILAVILAPITEELLFRGVLLRGLSPEGVAAGRIGWIPLCLQGTVFGVAHLTPSEGWGNLTLIGSLILMGIGLGLIARVTGRLGTSIVAHAGFNLGQLTLLWFTL